MRLQFVLALCVVSTILARIQRAEADEAPAPPKTWQESARESGLPEADVALLEKNRILVTNKGYKQIFSAYLGGGQPFFITSDSLLGAYHVLYEESILRLENALASRLPNVLKHILAGIEGVDDHLRGKPALATAAKKRAKLVTGVAMRLLDDSFRFENEKLNEILAKETKRIVEAKWVGMPEWLGKPDATFIALDYSRYRPRGFYTRSERLKRYFRAVSWLQSIPFRVEKDEELLAILILGECVMDSGKGGSEATSIEAFFRAYDLFIGPRDDRDLMTAARAVRFGLDLDLNTDVLDEIRERSKNAACNEDPFINDVIRLPRYDSTEPSAGYRIISAYRVPSAILFQRTTDPRGFRRPYPNGLEVSAALGSAFARARIADPQRESLLEAIDSCREHFPNGREDRDICLYQQYLDVLKTLLDVPEPDAPDFMKNEAWQMKSCNTVLAGWAQLRHTWALQTKQTMRLYCASDLPEGFVEPEPEFFAGMAHLANRTRRLLAESRGFGSDYSQALQTIENLRRLVKETKGKKRLWDILQTSPLEATTDIRLCFALAGREPVVDDQTGSSPSEIGQWLGTLAKDIQEGRLDKHPEVKKVLDEHEMDFEELWERLERTARRLETIAHKELREVKLNDDERRFVRDYGETIAGIMLYGGNSYLTPRDDAPRVIDVYSNPETGGYLHVGVARARAIYVLYPWQGETVLCRGAVMPYYEFVAPSRLTDAEWKKRLDSDDRPAIPKWAAPIVSGGKLDTPELKQDH